MIDNSISVLTFVSALGCGLMAGFFFAFSIVVKALVQQPPSQGIAAMPSMIIVVINSIFMTAFFVTTVTCLVLAISSIRWHTPGAAHLVGTILVTIVFNVPLNDALAAVDPASGEGLRLWTSFVSGWTAGNHVRTVAALGAAASFTIALCWRR